MPQFAEMMQAQRAALRLAEGTLGVLALQTRIARLQLDMLRHSQKLALKAINASAPLWQPALLASFRAPATVLGALRRPWAR